MLNEKAVGYVELRGKTAKAIARESFWCYLLWFYLDVFDMLQFVLPKQPANYHIPKRFGLKGSAFQNVTILGKTFQHPDDVTAAGSDFEIMRARMIDHGPVELSSQPLSLGFSGNPRVVDHDMLISALAVGHDGMTANREFTVGGRFLMVDRQRFTFHVVPDS